ncbi:TPA: 3-methyladenine DNA glycosylase [candidate division CPR2 bacterium]|uniref:Putative 3-methyladenine DNA glycosylase n=1 Tax=candidate division CPR2 bacterium GW2011_GWC1_41_48 TaxID=1618344 RepID=A0A0G0Z705_UNCC2|nr:MAG: hypothetical protein UT47_C0004G0101 [candidate division CPR2 bacterium GW2011_GWC2_39_35]KKR28659.1 MAG: hypothetical protein UT60_C0015G0013 [candidate division CPR2 bacterium GW2011_GWD2_39_7]KKS08808.1 MAG: hypothetical protein UU65_C0004G0019 [candidate division CPR2 bacterium GW2011_GWC1_41_48]OGB72962.1 MAG: hypothetical protein A2Y26_02520 [candidate division CPR2 bacterium GWD2_39_7]HBG81293.1 3-methyladenine DNA glycosylase [candidate division CPR2 bacterium]
MKLKRNFYSRDTLTVAKELLGKYLIHIVYDQKFVGKIVEVEAYIGEDDMAAHSRFGRTKRNEIMYGEPGHAYVYIIYGMYDMLNIVTEKKDSPGAVLIRAVELIGEKGTLKDLRKLGSGPGVLTRWMKITRDQNSVDLLSETLYIEDRGEKPEEIVETTRIGVEYAGDHANLPWRFYIKDNPFVSRK